MSRVDNEALLRYEQTRDAAVARLLALEERLSDENRPAVQVARLRLDRSKFVLAAVGEFSSGKSFLLNALLDRGRLETIGGRKQFVGLLAVDINPSTATITELAHADHDDATALYIDELGKPMLFVHTFADNQSAAERRRVVELASSYLRDRNIPCERMFTISARDALDAQASRRAPAAWNEPEALHRTLEAHAESHMARLARLERAGAAQSRAAPEPERVALFARLLRAGRPSGR